MSKMAVPAVDQRQTAIGHFCQWHRGRLLEGSRYRREQEAAGALVRLQFARQSHGKLRSVTVDALHLNFTLQ
jgi:hypothetical protein